ncbi:hypothetical protein ACFLUO_06670 [Chloroflexota bacterium]
MLKVLNIKELILSHILIVGGLVLISLGLAWDAVGYTIAGIWVLTIGLCVSLGAIFAKLMAK